MNRRITMQVVECRVCGYEWQAFPEEGRFCSGCIGTAIQRDADMIAQHIADAAAQTGRTVATVKRHWKAMIVDLDLAPRNEETGEYGIGHHHWRITLPENPSLSFGMATLKGKTTEARDLYVKVLTGDWSYRDDEALSLFGSSELEYLGHYQQS